MNTLWTQRLLLPLLLAAVSVNASSGSQMIITETRSTNRPQVTIKVESAKRASYLVDGATQPTHIDLESAQGSRLLQAAHAAAPLAALPVAHCMRSVSFGTSIYVQIGSDRSPDLSCSNQTDSRALALSNEVRQLLNQVRQQRRPR